ncbi:MAG: class I tRNA ligase family protein, partial [Acidisphaera sp.]|nr:class I tRNA ligase family protein [Acidisphaera sp.]
RDMEWTEAGVLGAFRFLQRIYRLAAEREGPPKRPATFGARATALRRVTHRTIAGVTEAFETFTFNVAVARIHELANAIADADRQRDEEEDAGLGWARSEALDAVTLLIAPVMPHLAEELRMLRQGSGAGLAAQAAWPVADAALLANEVVTVAVQVMGKLRGTVSVAPGTDREAVLALAERDPNVVRALAGRPVAKRIYVPDRVVNLVVSGQ